MTLEDLEAEHAHAECVVEGHVPDDAPTKLPHASRAVRHCPTIFPATR
jgi:hypothetical protein